MCWYFIVQFDPTFVSHSSAPGQPAPVFGGIPRPSFRPTIPSAGASFGLGAGTALHPTTAFPGDSNGVFNVSERPKKVLCSFFILLSYLVEEIQLRY